MRVLDIGEDMQHNVTPVRKILAFLSDNNNIC